MDQLIEGVGQLFQGLNKVLSFAHSASRVAATSLTIIDEGKRIEKSCKKKDWTSVMASIVVISAEATTAAYEVKRLKGGGLTPKELSFHKQFTDKERPKMHAWRLNQKVRLKVIPETLYHLRLLSNAANIFHLKYEKATPQKVLTMLSGFADTARIMAIRNDSPEWSWDLKKCHYAIDHTKSFAWFGASGGAHTWELVVMFPLDLARIACWVEEAKNG